MHKYDTLNFMEENVLISPVVVGNIIEKSLYQYEANSDPKGQLLVFNP